MLSKILSIIGTTYTNNKQILFSQELAVYENWNIGCSQSCKMKPYKIISTPTLGQNSKEILKPYSFPSLLGSDRHIWTTKDNAVMKYIFLKLHTMYAAVTQSEKRIKKWNPIIKRAIFIWYTRDQHESRTLINTVTIKLKTTQSEFANSEVTNHWLAMKIFLHIRLSYTFQTPCKNKSR